EAPVVGDSLTQVAEAGQRHVPLPVEVENVGDLLGQPGNIVPLALLAELTEVREVPPDLRRRHPDALPQLLRRDAGHARVQHLLERALVDRQAPNHDVWNLTAF